MTEHKPIVPVILSGGSGTRLWPMSRPEMPKQMLALTAEETMLQLTARRTPAGERFAAPVIVANALHADMVEDGWLVTFGIAPDAPETGYGYIQVGEPIGSGVHKVQRFVEKPKRELAEAMIAAGDHAWNGGIFLFRADAYLEALARFAPEMLAAAQAAMARAVREGTRILPDAVEFAKSPSDSIDYAVMEKAARVAVVPVSMDWSDVGSWDMLHAISDCDEAGNACRGDVVAIDTADCLVRAGPGKRVALVGVTDLIVVADGDDVLILPRGRSQDVKRIIEAMKK